MVTRTKAPSFGPGYQGGLRHGRCGALQDHNPKEPGGSHGEGDGYTEKEEKKQEQYSQDPDGGEHYCTSPSGTVRGVSAPSPICSSPLGFPISRAASTREQNPI